MLGEPGVLKRTFALDSNVYKTPEAALEDSAKPESNLATRASRLGASLIDSIILWVIMLPILYLTGVSTEVSQGSELSILRSVLACFLSLFIFALVNYQMLVTTGQTIGKRLLDIKMVDQNGDLPGLSSHLVKRYLVYFVPGAVPVFGQLFAVINFCFIFGSHRRCVHDYVAGTRVVNAR